MCSTSTSRSRAGPSAEPSQPSSARSSSAPLLIDERPCRPQECSRPACRDPHLVEILRDRCRDACPDRAPTSSARCSRSAAAENLLRRGVVARAAAVRDGRGESSARIELRPKPGRLGARGEQLLLQPPERALVALADELHFELAEPLLDALTLHDRHGVLDDLRAGGPQGLPPRAQARDARWLRRREDARGGARAARPAAVRASRGPRSRCGRRRTGS